MTNPANAASREARDPLALAMFAAWVNSPVDKLPPEMLGHTCAATMEAWGRVADAARLALDTAPTDQAQRGEVERLLEALREIALETHETIPPDGKVAGFAALERIARITVAAIAQSGKGVE